VEARVQRAAVTAEILDHVAALLRHHGGRLRHHDDDEQGNEQHDVQSTHFFPLDFYAAGVGRMSSVNS
jgi:hypothetical protein